MNCRNVSLALLEPEGNSFISIKKLISALEKPGLGKPKHNQTVSKVQRVKSVLEILHKILLYCHHRNFSVFTL